MPSKTIGQERWRQPATDSWNTPTLFHFDGRTELIFVSGSGTIAAADPSSGARLWEFDAQIRRINPTIVRGDGLYFAFGGPNGSSAALQVDRAGGAPRVTNARELKKSSYITSAVFREGHLYWANEGGGIAYCVNARSGAIVYQQRLEPVSGEIYASPVLAEGRIHYLSRDRGTFLVAARPEFQLLAHNVIETDKTNFNGSPAVSGGRIFLRSDSAVYCIADASHPEASGVGQAASFADLQRARELNPRDPES